MLYKGFVAKIILIWAINFHILAVECSESCWNNDNECNIKTQLFKNIEFSNGISMQIDCRLNMEANEGEDQIKKDKKNFEMSANNLLSSRFMGIQSVMLDGCQTPLNARTFGFELLPICANITKAAIKHFHMETLKPLYCDEEAQQIQLEYLNIQSNEITFIDESSFSIRNTQLKSILLQNNLLKIIYKDAFKATNALQSLFIINEPMLMLKFPDLFENLKLSIIHLDTLKQIKSDMFEHLPETLHTLYVANTQLDDGTVLVRNSLVLRNLTIKNIALRNFTLLDAHSTVKYIDLSGNVMKTFTAYENSIKELNLSNNQLESLQLKWLINLTNLEYCILKGNHIKTLSLNDVLRALPNGKLLDLNQNRLKQLQDYENVMQDAQLSQIRISCDQNPWDCLWLHTFAHYHPEKFRILQYKKFISKINVNGLECIPAEKPLETINKQPKIDNRISTTKVANVSTYTLMYGSPWEIKRNQRAEALIIVFMLPLGIAILFVLLYMWIYCQKIFHLSFYKNVPCVRPSDNHTAQRFDIIRQIPPMSSNHMEPKRFLTCITDENEESYEIPISGIVSECNCMNKQNDEETDQCQKSIHITYEHLPNEEPPQRIYEEIIHLDCPIKSTAAD